MKGRPPSIKDYPLWRLTPRKEESLKRPDVSIVTVVLNGEQHIQEAIDSVANQDFNGTIEYIVVDGESTDGTVEILRFNEQHISWWTSEPDKGLYDAMNKGIAMSRGRLVKLLNADDLLPTNSVSSAVRLHERQAEPCVINSDLEVIDFEGKLLKNMGRGKGLNPVGAFLHPSWFVDRRIYEEFGLYHSTFRVSADYEFFLRLHTRGVPFVHAQQTLSQFRSGGASSSLTGVPEQFTIDRDYFNSTIAYRYAALRMYKKLRSRVLLKLIGERRMYQLRELLQSFLASR